MTDDSWARKELERQGRVQEEMRVTLNQLVTGLAVQRNDMKWVAGKVAAYVSSIIAAVSAALYTHFRDGG